MNESEPENVSKDKGMFFYIILKFLIYLEIRKTRKSRKIFIGPLTLKETKCKEKAKARMKRFLEKETPKEKEIRLAKKRKNSQERYNNMSAEDRAQYNEYMRKKMAEYKFKKSSL